MTTQTVYWTPLLAAAATALIIVTSFQGMFVTSWTCYHSLQEQKYWLQVNVKLQFWPHCHNLMLPFRLGVDNH
ncbi:hypothetical protein EDD18DRAFT_1199771 [Armillaria luteobubalina]|uniref:Uncharacterized protein n=1 Tax=Armillaria luteobubalina TaxID=153913 RepID=A0AA39PGD3_9AGAR|nr:hypothetical protein EDD18DRAFT_1199771 [Armillaria luteobubalina]